MKQPRLLRIAQYWIAFLGIVIGLLPDLASANHRPLELFNGRNIVSTSWLVQSGDSLAYAMPQYNDEDWKLAKGPHLWASNHLPEKGIHWYRVEIKIDSQAASIKDLSIFAFWTITAAELYWDGILLGRNGTVSPTRDKEVPGKFNFSVSVPESLSTSGSHLLALRISNHSTLTGCLGRILIGENTRVTQLFYGELAIIILFTGIFIVAALVNFSYFLSRFRPNYAYFSIFCLACAGDLITKIFGPFLGLSVLHVNLVYNMAILSWIILMSSLLLFFFSEFHLASRRKLLVIVILVLVFSIPVALLTLGYLPASWLRLIRTANLAFSFTAIVASIVVCIRAYRRKMTGSREAVLGLCLLLIGLLLTLATTTPFYWIYGLTGLVISIHVSLNRQWRESARSYANSQLRSARLEIELLKKNIQPHFLLNSLNSVTEWLEKDPKTAAKLVNSLAQELRQMLKMSSEKMITLSEELKLCDSHLELMHLRENWQCQLIPKNLDLDTELPPMVLYTLIEQFLALALRNREKAIFHLEQQRIENDNLFILCMKNAAWLFENNEILNNTGILYVKARMEEVYPGQWILKQESQQGDWMISLRFPQQVLSAA